jgi:hypothetical protein
LIQSIRPATAEDIAGIQAVGAAAWRDTYTGLAPDGYITDLRLSVHPVLLRPPFNAAERSYLEDHVLANLRTVPRERVPTLDDATWARWERLRDPESPDYLFAQPDYYCVQFGLLASGAVPSV